MISIWYTREYKLLYVCIILMGNFSNYSNPKITSLNKMFIWNIIEYT